MWQKTLFLLQLGHLSSKQGVIRRTIWMVTAMTSHELVIFQDTLCVAPATCIKLFGI